MHGKALVVDLTTKKSQEQEIPQKYYEQYIGGRGLGGRLLHDLVDPKVDPLSPENVLMFVAGPLNATRAFYSSKSVIVTKSPLSGTCLYTISSGQFCHSLAKCGYDVLIIKGKSPQPVYLLVHDKAVEFKDASKIWGMNTGDADYFIAQKVPAHSSIALIGPAGENLVKYACVVTEGRQRNAFGRGGAGAVMGSKNLKAVAVHGTGEAPIADAAALKEAQRFVNQRLAAAPDWKVEQRKYGTRGSLVMLDKAGILPTRQWYTGKYLNVQMFAPEKIRNDWIVSNESCAPYCPNPCYHWSTVKEGEYAGATSFGPEYETIYAFGSNLENPRFDSIIAADDFCDLMGLDTMSAGMTIGWATECYERGILTSKDTDGIDMKYGNHEMLLQLIHKIAYRQGFGDLLAEGSQRAAAKVGQGSDAWAMTAKGMEFGGYECRGSWGQAIQFAFSHRGGCHHDLGLPARIELGTPEATKVEGRGEVVKAAASRRIIYDCSVMCTFPLGVIGLESASGLLSAVKGQNLDLPKLYEIGERVLNMERPFISKAGFGRSDDRLPPRMLNEPLPHGPSRGKVVPLEALKDEFYGSCGWDPKTGVPKTETLQRLGIELRP
ncbi:MAG: aldehyde ferredoxin oxidoreductase family protein [Betaproteobacteria bacterium]|nr:aldehyde ferredoxin oxidoreductase family protein [Betaproteobacteria bacterium]